MIFHGRIMRLYPLVIEHSNGQWPMIYEDLLLGNGHFPGCIAPLRAAIAADRSPASAPTVRR